MRGIVSYFIKYPVAANLLMFGIFILGFFGAKNMKTTFFPEVESRIISIQAIYPGASPEEVEEGIVSKIEDNLKGLTGVERYTSVSSENSGSITVEVLKGYDTDIILQDVKNAVDRINSFPTSMEPLVVYKRENLGQAISMAISGDVSLATLKRYGREVEDDLLAMPGLSKVELSGFPEEEIEIAFRERDLRAFGLTFQEAADAVRRSNVDITGGTIKGKQEELLVRARSKEYFADGLLDIVVKNTPWRWHRPPAAGSRRQRSLVGYPESFFSRRQTFGGRQRAEYPRRRYGEHYRSGESLCRKFQQGPLGSIHHGIP